jgi:hypothetical protein
MPNDQQDNTGGTIETEVGRLPEATRAPEGFALAEAMQQPTLSDEELQQRQAAIGTRRKPDGPPRDEGLLDDANTQPSDVPETETTPSGEDS